MNKNTFPLVSIMIPVFNAEKTLPLAIPSLLQQTYKNWKAIIVNDGSTDGTKQYLESLNDPRFKVIHFQKNKGRPYARQAALEAAEGKYLAFLDADDFYHPEKLEKQVRLMEENPDVDLVSCANASFDSDFNLLTVRGKGVKKVQKFLLTNKLNCALRTSILRLNKAKEIKFNLRLKHAQDTDFLSRYLDGNLYMIMPEVLYYYSEFVSVTGKKIIKTYKYSLLRTLNNFKAYPFFVIKESFVIILKTLLTVIILPIFGSEYLLKKRGIPPSGFEVDSFINCLNKIR